MNGNVHGVTLTSHNDTPLNLCLIKEDRVGLNFGNELLILNFCTLNRFISLKTNLIHQSEKAHLKLDMTTYSLWDIVHNYRVIRSLKLVLFYPTIGSIYKFLPHGLNANSLKFILNAIFPHLL